MANSLEAAAAALNKAAQAFGSGPARKHRSEWRQPYAAGLRFVLLDLVGDGNWKELSRLAASVRHDATYDLMEMSRQQSEWRRMSDSLEVVRAQLADRWHAPNTFTEWVAKHDTFVEELVERGMNRERAIEALSEFGRASARDVIRNIEKPLDAWSMELESCTIGRLAALSAADLSDAVAKLNEHATHSHEEHVSAAAALSRVREHFRELYDELKRDDDRQLEERAKGIEATIDDVLEPLLRAAAFTAHAVANSSDAAKGRTGIAIGDAIRACLLLRSAARVIVWTSGWGKSSLLHVWRTAAREKALASTFHAPQVQRLSDLGTSPAIDGEQISVEGWMGPITISHHGRKALSTATMTDRAGHELQIGLPYIKLDSGGIVENTYVRFVGNFHRQHHDFAGQVFVPARRSLTQGSQHSWMDWLTLKLMPVATPVAHNLAAAWSWAVGSDGAGNPLRYGTWASTRKGLH